MNNAHHMFASYRDALPPGQRVRWDLKNATQRLMITSRACRHALADGRDITELLAVRTERAQAVSDLRWDRDRPRMSPFGAALAQSFSPTW